VTVSEEHATRVGVSNTDVALAFLSSYEGHELTRFHDGEDEIPVLLRLRDDERGMGGDLASLPVASSVTGEKVPLGSIAAIEPQWGAGVVKRVDNRRVLTVRAHNRGRLADDVVRDAVARVESLNLPPGYRVEVAGEKAEMDKAFGELLMVFGLIVAGLVIILVLQLGTLRRTAVVLLSIPLALLGVGVALVVGGYSFSFMVFLGVVSLAGMVIKNAIVWVEFVEQARERGAALHEAVVEAGLARLRPILLTTVTTVGGLIPLALFGGVLFESMAWSMIAGLSWATLLTLVVIPVFYSLLLPDKQELWQTAAQGC
jgi:multidrug efflux pump subunit AcrB